MTDLEVGQDQACPRELQKISSFIFIIQAIYYLIHTFSYLKTPKVLTHIHTFGGRAVSSKFQVSADSRCRKRRLFSPGSENASETLQSALYGETAWQPVSAFDHFEEARRCTY